jgi:hypothetical protein
MVPAGGRLVFVGESRESNDIRSDHDGVRIISGSNLNVVVYEIVPPLLGNLLLGILLFVIRNHKIILLRKTGEARCTMCCVECGYHKREDALSFYARYLEHELSAPVCTAH